MTTEGKCRFGVTGLAVMGANLARNVASRGIPVAIHNRTQSKADDLYAEHGKDGPLTLTHSVEEFVAAIERPRPILIMVQAGKPVDAVIAGLEPYLDPGDILIDGGNSLFTDTQRRTRDLEAKGLRFLGIGVSGGEEGALHGPSIMPGGTPEAYERVEEVLTAIAAQVKGEPCCAYMGPDGAGHYVKMVHNGIEYALMQLIAESYDLLHQVLGLSPSELSQVFADWNEGDLQSFLVEITSTVLAKTDAATGQPLVDVILDEAEQKGTGRWTVQSALDMGVPTPDIAEAVLARSLSALKDERVQASKILTGPDVRFDDTERERNADLVDAVRDALYAAELTAYAQGFAQLMAASKQYNWNLHPGSIATIWRGGCIIRARFLDRIKEAYDADPELHNLLLAPYFRDTVVGAQASWRRVVGLAVESGVPAPVYSAALAYYDGYRRERTPANLIQGLRDLFGAHTYHRVDRPGTFHVRWSEDGAEEQTS